MAKMDFKDKPKEDVPAPMLIFSEAEVQKVVAFVNFVYLNADFKMNMKQATEVKQMFNDMHAHVQKIEGYILEHKRTTQKKAE